MHETIIGQDDVRTSGIGSLSLFKRPLSILVRNLDTKKIEAVLCTFETSGKLDIHYRLIAKIATLALFKILAGKTLSNDDARFRRGVDDNTNNERLMLNLLFSF